MVNAQRLKPYYDPNDRPTNLPEDFQNNEEEIDPEEIQDNDTHANDQPVQNNHQPAIQRNNTQNDHRQQNQQL